MCTNCQGLFGCRPHACPNKADATSLIRPPALSYTPEIQTAQKRNYKVITTLRPTIKMRQSRPVEAA